MLEIYQITSALILRYDEAAEAEGVLLIGRIAEWYWI